MLILGKALGGGIIPISAVVSTLDVMDVLIPGDHGSTFGGNPLACALSCTALEILEEENLYENAFLLGDEFRHAAKQLPQHIIKEVRGKGLLNAIEIHPGKHSGRYYVEKLCEQGLLAKDTHSTTIRFAPPLNISKQSLDYAIKILSSVFT